MYLQGEDYYDVIKLSKKKKKLLNLAIYIEKLE